MKTRFQDMDLSRLPVLSVRCLAHFSITEVHAKPMIQKFRSSTVLSRSFMTMDFKFVVTTQEDHLTHASRSRLISAARSFCSTRQHASRRALLSARIVVQRPKKPSRSPTSTKSIGAKSYDDHPASYKQDDSERRQTGEDLEPWPVTQIHSTLDPFVRLPLEVSGDEKSAIHFCG